MRSFKSLGAAPRRRPQTARPCLEALEQRELLDSNLGPFLFGPAQPASVSNFYLADAAHLVPAAPLQSPGTPSLPAAFLTPSAGAGAVPALAAPGPSSASATDPAVPGPYAVTRQEYSFGNAALKNFTHAVFNTNGVEFRASVHAPTDLSAFDHPLPLIVLLHGRHAVIYFPGNPTGFLGNGAWPPPNGYLPIDSYKGYDYLASNLASHGYIVVSISANGINNVDNSSPDGGMLARAQLIQRHLDLWADFNRDGVVTPHAGETGVSGSPLGTRFVGKVDLQNVGLMGHSRGGEGVVREVLYNRSLGSPYGIKAVLPLAPVDFSRPVANNVPLLVLLPYDDGDVSDLQGVHFYDDALYNVPGDLSPKHVVLVAGGNHDFFNTVWTPGGFPAGTFDDSADFLSPPISPNLRLTPVQEQAVGLVYMAAFFRTNLGGETTFLPLLKGDAAPPASAQSNAVYASYQAPDSPAYRRDVNRYQSSTSLTTNSLGGAVVTGGLTSYQFFGANFSQFGVFGHSTPQEPEYVQSVLSSSSRGTGEALVSWTNTANAFYENDLPAGSRDVSGYYALSFRAGVNFTDARNKSGLTTPPAILRDRFGNPQDFHVTLTDGAGHSVRTDVGSWSRSLFYPLGPAGPGTIPRLFDDTVRIPLSAFRGVDLTDVRSIRFTFDDRESGDLLLTDLAFVDPAGLYAGPFVTFATTSGSATGSIDTATLSFNVPVDPATFTPDAVRVTGPGGAPVSVLGVTPAEGSNDAVYVVHFDAQSAPGLYTVAVGPNVRDFAGNAMDQDLNGVPGEDPGDVYTTTFSISPAAPTYTAAATAFENLELFGSSGAFTVIPQADDETAPIDLGSNTFNFYGVTYTGANQLYVSSNGLISLGFPNREFASQSLGSSPAPNGPILAPLWDDWYKADGVSQPMVLAKFDGDRLIVEWHQVHYADGTPLGSSSSFTFQAILSLNTGDAPGDVVFNYVDTSPSDAAHGDGRTATVGIQNGIGAGASFTQVSYRALSPLVGSGKAIRFSAT
jgi:hypothetical protein